MRNLTKDQQSKVNFDTDFTCPNCGCIVESDWHKDMLQAIEEIRVELLRLRANIVLGDGT